MDAWIQLARRWLRLPKGNPSVPAGNPASVKTWNPAEGYLSYQMLGFWLSAVPLLLTCLGSFVSAGIVPALMARENEIPEALVPLVAVGFVAFGLLMLFVAAFNYAVVHLELDMLRYTLTDRAIRLRRGVLAVEEVTLSYANIQNVKYNQGPVQRYFGIGDLIVETAGGGGVNPQQPGAGLHHRGLIKGVGNPEALRDMILERVRKVRGGGGLGDASPTKAKRKPDGAFDSPKGRALLAEIRDSLAAINAG